MLDFGSLVFAKAGHALRIERAADLAGALLAVETLDGGNRSRSRTSVTTIVGVIDGGGDRDVEMRNPPADVGDDFRELCLSIGAIGAGGEYPHRPVIFADAIDPAGQMKFGAERGLEKPVGDFAVGESLLLGALARGDGGIFGAVRRSGHAAECHRGEDKASYPQM